MEERGSVSDTGTYHNKKQIIPRKITNEESLEIMELKMGLSNEFGGIGGGQSSADNFRHAGGFELN